MRRTGSSCRKSGAAGAAFFLVGLPVERRGFHLIEKLKPPVVTGAIVALIGLNLARVARDNFVKQPAVAGITLAATPVIGVAVRGFFGRLSILLGVLGGATAALSGMIAVVGARIWIEARVEFRDPVNLITAAIALIVGAASCTVHAGSLEFNRIALGSFGAIAVYHLPRRLGRASFPA